MTEHELMERALRIYRRAGIVVLLGMILLTMICLSVPS
jgi:hypothetical protein